MAAAHVPLQKDKPKPKPKTCSGSEMGDVIGSVTAHLGLAAAGIISPPGVQCGTGAADLALTVGEETGIVCGGSLKTESPVWRGINLGLASAGAAISCVPVVGNIFNAGKTVYTAGELAVRGVGEGVSKAVGWFTGLFRPRVTAKAVSTGIELVERTRRRAQRTSRLRSVRPQARPSRCQGAQRRWPRFPASSRARQ
jgi:hypothetical protein